MFQTCLVRGTGNIVVCSVSPVRYICVCGHTHTMEGSYTSNTSNMIKPTLVIITDRMSGTQNPALAVPVAPESVNPAQLQRS